MNRFRGLLYGTDIEQNNVISDHEEINRLFKAIDAETQKKLSHSEIVIGAKLVEIFGLYTGI